METGFGLGILVILTGSTANSAFGLGLKFTRSWKWEHIWLLFSVTAMILIPWLLGFLTIESLFGVLAAADGRDLLLVFLFGMGWGVGSVLYGLALKMVGLALSYAIVMGLTAAVGTMAPFVLLHWDDFLTFKGMVISAGVLLVVGGVLLSAWAGKLREESPERLQESVESAETPAKESRRSAAVLLGLLVAALSGILSPMLNLSFAYGIRLADQAVLLGTSPSMASNVIWVVALTAGFLVNAGYCVYLIVKGRSWRTFRGQPFHYGVGAAMGILWVSGVVTYGIGGSMLGDMREVIGWPMASAMSIIAATFWGALSGEWTGASRRSMAVMGVSILVLSASMFLIGWTNTLG
ncbi:MAG: hypothetical protein OXH11_08185 [Candidatus Aminicenantes bacterium]|nr:hypothetical protein [Candidatus Aminicenantes bacterium]